jgi:hypothetical protein
LNPDYSLMFGRLERAWQECRSDAVSRAVADLNASLVTELHSSKDAQLVARR